MQNEFYIDDSKWPLLFIRFPPQPNTGNIDNYAAHLERFFLRAHKERVRFAAIFDLRRVEDQPDAKLRKYLKDKVDAVWAKHPHEFLCEAVILDKQWHKWVNDAFNFMREAKYPMKNYTDSEQALAWVKAMLRQAATPQ